MLSDADLDVLLYRKPEVFSEHRKGWVSYYAGGVAQDGIDGMDQDVSDLDYVAVGEGKVAFSVYEAPVDSLQRRFAVNHVDILFCTRFRGLEVG